MKAVELPTLGQQLKAARKRVFPSDTQQDFARRIGVSRYTYQKMEQGQLNIAFAHYYAAAQLLGVAAALEQAFAAPKDDLFAGFN